MLIPELPDCSGSGVDDGVGGGDGVRRNLDSSVGVGGDGVKRNCDSCSCDMLPIVLNKCN